MPTSYTSLEPKSLSSLGVQAPAFNGGNTSFLATSTFLYTLFFVAIVGAAFYRYGVAGILRMQASEPTIRKSNEIIKQVTLGLLGVFSLFLILFTVNKGLITGDVGLEGLRATNGGVSGGTTPATTQQNTAQPSGSGSSAIQNDGAVRAQLANINISVNKNVCSSPSQTGCTTVGGLPDSTITMLGQLRDACRGSIVVTGGTEAGHKSHGPGLTPVDISLNDSTLNACIRAFTSGPSLSWCNSTFTNFGYIFCDEKNTEAHWHVYK